MLRYPRLNGGQRPHGRGKMSGYVNRLAIIVYARQPMVDWINEVQPLDGKEWTVDSLRDTPMVFLISNDPTLDSGDGMLKYLKDPIFGCWLEDVEEDEAKWPKDRSWKVFQKWFECVVVHPVIDLERKDPIEVTPPSDPDEPSL